MELPAGRTKLTVRFRVLALRNGEWIAIILWPTDDGQHWYWFGELQAKSEEEIHGLIREARDVLNEAVHAADPSAIIGKLHLAGALEDDG